MSKLDQYIELHKTGILPSSYPEEYFYYYSLPDFDESKFPSLTQGKNIESNKFLVNNNQILISKLNPRIKRVWKVENNEKYRSISSTEFVVVNPKNISIDYLSYLLSTEDVYKQLESNAIGSTNSHTRFNPKILYSLFAYIPKEKHQHKIANIIRTVETVIEQTQSAIAKYRTIKQGILHDLFTRGINIKTGKLRPRFLDAPQLYKESKLGMVPIVLDVERLGNRAVIEYGI